MLRHIIGGKTIANFIPSHLLDIQSYLFILRRLTLLLYLLCCFLLGYFGLSSESGHKCFNLIPFEENVDLLFGLLSQSLLFLM